MAATSGRRNLLARGPQSGAIGRSSIDPFETLPVNALRLTTLLHLKSSLRAGEPIFSVNGLIHHQSLQTTFESGLGNGALTAALGLTLSYAANGWRMNSECIELSLIAMRQMHQMLSDPVAAASPATIGTVLLLLGNAYRLGELHSAKAHLQGLQTLLLLCSRHDIKLPSALKRAIYWQDLFSSIFLGTDRIVEYATFYPGQRSRVERTGRDTHLPCGFAKSAQLLGPEFLDIATDVAILYDDRQSLLPTFDNSARVLERLDNVQAQLEGRLHTLRLATSDHTLLSCILATQLCVYGFWDGIWNATLIPRELSSKLLYHLRCCQLHEPEDYELIFWLVHVGKAFAIDVCVRAGLDDLSLRLHDDAREDVSLSWDEAKRILDKFIWSDVLYSEMNGWFWEKIGE